MKKFYFLMITVIVLSATAIARENPFEPTAMFEEDFERMIEATEGYPYEFQQKDEKNMNYEKVSEPPKKVTPKAVKKAEVKQKKTPVKEVVYVPLRDQPRVKKATIFIIPGVEIAFEGKKLEINSKYEVFQKFNVNNRNKIVLDFRAETIFNTIKKDLNSEYFNKVTVGNHPKEKYFRIVFELPTTPKDYRVTYDKNVVKIMFEESSLKQ